MKTFLTLLSLSFVVSAFAAEVTPRDQQIMDALNGKNPKIQKLADAVEDDQSLAYAINFLTNGSRCIEATEDGKVSSVRIAKVQPRENDAAPVILSLDEVAHTCRVVNAPESENPRFYLVCSKSEEDPNEFVMEFVNTLYYADVVETPVVEVKPEDETEGDVQDFTVEEESEGPTPTGILGFAGDYSKADTVKKVVKSYACYFEL